MNPSHQASAATLTLPSAPAARAHPSDSAAGPFARAWEKPLTWHRHSRSRRERAELDDHLLADIGLTRQQVANERSKFFWQV